LARCRLALSLLLGPLGAIILVPNNVEITSRFGYILMPSLLVIDSSFQQVVVSHVRSMDSCYRFQDSLDFTPVYKLDYEASAYLESVTVIKNEILCSSGTHSISTDVIASKYAQLDTIIR
jgi:hypothetical protein